MKNETFRSLTLGALFACLAMLPFAPAAETRIPTDLNVEGALRVGGAKPEYERTYLKTDVSQAYTLAPGSWRVWDAYGTALPGTSSADDLGVYAGTFGTGTPYVATYDVKAAGAVTLRARTLFQLPPEYVAQAAASLRAYSGMITTIASVSATVDFEAYKVGSNTLISGSDLVATAAQSINSTTFANKEFLLTSTSLSPGDVLDIRVTVAVNDAASATAVIAAIALCDVLLSVKG